MKAPALLIQITLAIAGVALTTARADADQLPMDSYLVDTGFFYYYDLGVDLAGHAHAFIDETSEDSLYYSDNVGGDWSTPVFIANTSDWGTINVSGAVEADGTAHIAYDSGPGGGGGNDILTYATNPDGSWQTEQVRTYSRWYSLDLSPAGEPRVSYYHDYSGLNYGILTGTTWSHEVVDSTGDIATYAGRYTNQVVDDSDHAHIVYYNYTTDAIRYATNSSGSWVWDEVVSDPDSGYAKVALDLSGNPLVAYRAAGRVWLARQDNGGWEPTPVTEAGNYGYLDVDTAGDGTVCVVYNDNSTTRLMLAVENGDTFDLYEIYSRLADGSGPIIQMYGRAVNVLVWSQSGQMLYHLIGDLPLPGDYDGDGDVDLSDLAFLLSDYGCDTGDCPGDIDGDGDTDLADLALLLSYYGTGT